MKTPKIGLALGGGGARGFSHLGVLKALEESGITISYIAGVSMGAIMGAGYAHKKDLAKLVKATDEFDYTEYIRPYNQRILINLDKIISYFNDYLGNSSFEDFAIPVSIVTTDFKARKSFIINTGKVAIAVAASSTAPYIHKPIKHKGKLLVDGGLVSNVPVDVVEKMGADVIIGVDVKADTSFVNTYYLNDLQKNLISKFPFASLIWGKQLTGFLRHSNQVVSNELDQLRFSMINKPLLLIKPQLGNMTSISFDRKEYAIKAGYLAAKKELKKLKEINQTLELVAA